ncbi:cation-transporting P-type ATPase [bacterium]|nr:cation-transporting P-type ATPase [bacterium]QQR59510.1 MAG: cation-transporting P-type ATPase [Candidatus Melainabacteria bacterium]
MTCQTNEVNVSNLGLDSNEAANRLKRHGLNSIAVEVHLPIVHLIRENFFHTMAILLWVGGAVGFLASMPEIAIAIWLVNIINGSFSIMQEYRAFRATTALKSLLPEEATVFRDAVEKRIISIHIVPGDVILLAEGDKIPADCRLIESEKLMVDESILTGESNPTIKLIERDNVTWAGTTVVSGHARVLAFATGHNTKFGKIAHLTQTIADRPSPLQAEMSRVAKRVSIMACVIGIIMFILASFFSGQKPAQAFIFAMGMIVAFVPEGMVPTVTLSLALAVKRMAKRQALVKRLSSVEALGCTNVICTDKTGTITENKMKVTSTWTMDGWLNFEDANAKTENKDFKTLFEAAVLCNNAHKTKDTLTGDPTETAILTAGELVEIFQESIVLQFPRIREEPFDSLRKSMSTLHKNYKNDLLTLNLKGSPEAVLKKCSHYQKEGQSFELLPESTQLINQKISEFALKGLRIIAVAQRQLTNEKCNYEQSTEQLESQLTFLGLIALHDPPRPEVEEALKRCKEAGVQVVMITGDHEVTAKAIAQRVGMVDANARVITGLQLDLMNNQELIESLGPNILFARVNPEHKLKIVSAFQKSGKITAVTGDGVNDGPALKQADIGVAMGKNGTDVAREASDIILLDDNFASIVNAIEEGRTVYKNIKKFATYVFNSNMAEAVPFAVMLFSGGLIPMPLTVMQVLSIDLGTDMVPAIALGADRTDWHVMSAPPRKRDEPLLSKNLLCKALLWYGLIEACAGMSCYFFSNWLNCGWPLSPLAAQGTAAWSHATTMTLTGVVACQIGAVFCCRTNTRSMFDVGLFSNTLIWWGIAFEIALLMALMHVPILQKVFDTTALSSTELLFAIIWIPIIIALDETRKWILRRRISTKVIKSV